MNIRAFCEIRNELAHRGATLVAVSKTQSVQNITILYEAGQRIFGENKVQEMCEKRQSLPQDIEWHMIGHLQTNKVKYIAPFVSLIHSVDSLRLLIEINKQAQKHHRIINCLLQFHIAQEDTKFGFTFEEAVEALNSDVFRSLQNIKICGVMGMATYTQDEHTIEREFLSLKKIFAQLRSAFFSDGDSFKELSMGMTHDYKIALSCGSTMVRIGSKIFGERRL